MGELKFANSNGELIKKKLEKGDLSNDYIFDKAQKIVKKANENGLLLRLLGATAFIYHCPAHRHLYEQLERKLTDVDVITYSKFKATDIEKTFKGLGFEKQRYYVWHAESREIYYNKDGLFVDVFLDELNFSHVIDFRGRLELDNPTITIEDLLFEKLQIHDITPKDFKDVIVLLLEHNFGSKDNKEELDTDYIAKVLANDWGFYYDATNNLKKIADFAESFDLLNNDEKAKVKDKINTLLSIIEEEPKSKKWLRRAKKGTKKKWYNEVGEIQQGV